MNRTDELFPGSSFADLINPTRRATGDLAAYDEILWAYGGLLPPGRNLGDVMRLATKTYGHATYDIANATTTARIWQLNDAQNLMHISQTGLGYGVEIPWNPAWVPGPGNDRVMVLVDWNAERYYTLRRVTTQYSAFDDRGFLYPIFGSLFSGPNTKAGLKSKYSNGALNIGAASINITTDIGTNNDRMRPNPLPTDRGCGLPKMALTVRGIRVAEAIQDGSYDLGHALPLSVSITMHGPDSSGKAPFFLPPATRLEWLGGNWAGRCNGSRVPSNLLSVPQGLMIAIEPNWDPEPWIAAEGFTAAEAEVARVLVMTAKVRGIVVGAETGCGASAVMEADGFLGDTAADWTGIGLEDDGSDYPSGRVITRMLQRQADGKLNFYVLTPPPAERLIDVWDTDPDWQGPRP